MNYRKVYDNLISKALERGLTKKDLNYHTERHHILPRCCGGQDKISNFVLLTPKEHYVAHHLLYKMHPNHDGCFLAYHMMANVRGHLAGISAKEYEILKNKQAAWIECLHTPEMAAKMRKPKTITAKRKAECERRKETMRGEGNPMFGVRFEWYNDGKRNFRISGEPLPGLVKGKIQKKVIRSTYILDGIEFHSEKEIYKHSKSDLPFSTWKRKNYELLKRSKQT